LGTEQSTPPVCDLSIISVPAAQPTTRPATS
jgi:NhaP-type Na+/H+ or K+/H+ antiporter